MYRSTSHRAAAVIAIVCFGACLTAQTAQAAPRYELTILRPIAGEATSAAQFGLNESGSSVGTSGGQGNRRATLWNRNGTPTRLARPSNAIFSRATGINDDGVIVGAVDTTGQPDLSGLRAARWKSPGRYEFVLPDTGYDSDAEFINEDGWIVGILFTGSTFTAYIASPQGRVDYPAPLNNGDTFELLSINRHRQAVGFDAGDSGTTAVRWSNARGLENLGLLRGGTTSAAASINDRGTIGGVADDATGIYRAVRWSHDGTIVELKSLRNAVYSDTQFGINNHDFSVGVTIFDGTDLGDYLSQRATLWNPSGKAFNLNKLIAPGSGVTLLTASGINDSGMIYGDCVDAAGDRFAYLLNPHNRHD